MAIAFAHARYLSRASGGNAVRSASYNAREAITAERTGELFHFRHRDAPEHYEVLLPEAPTPGSPTAQCCGTRRRRRSAARTPGSPARSCWRCRPSGCSRLKTGSKLRVQGPRRATRRARAAQGTRGREGACAEGTGSDHTNWHPHLLIATRRIEGDHLAAKKARDFDPEVRRAGPRTLVTDAEAWGETWRAHQDRYFHKHGIALRVDATAAHPREHIGRGWRAAPPGRGKPDTKIRHLPRAPCARTSARRSSMQSVRAG